MRKEKKKKDLIKLEVREIENLIQRKGLTIEILKSYFIPISLLKKYASTLNSINLSFVFKNQELDVEFVEKYGSRVSFNLLFKSVPKLIPMSILESNIEKLSYEEICEVCKSCVLSIDFMEKYYDVLDKYEISEHQKLDENFIRNHFKSLPIFRICRTQKLSENFMREFCNDLDWYYLSGFQFMSKEFAIEFANRIILTNLMYNSCIDLEDFNNSNTFEIIELTSKIMGSPE